MPKERLSMRKIREVLRQKAEKRSLRQIANGLGIGRGTVSDYLLRAKAAGLSWPLADGLDDHALEAALFPPPPDPATRRPLPDWTYIHKELKRKHVTLALLWQEYAEEHCEGYQYSRFCELYRSWQGTLWLDSPRLGSFAPKGQASSWISSSRLRESNQKSWRPPSPLTSSAPRSRWHRLDT